MKFSSSSVLSWCSLLVAASTVSGQQEAVAPEDSAVVKLSTDSFNEYIQSHDLVLAEFFAPWCGHCKNMAPEYVKAAEALVEKNITLAQIDCTENQDLCMEHNIPGFPSLKIFKNNDFNNSVDYEGARTAQAIVQFMIKQSQPAVTVVADVAAYLANETFVTPVIVQSGKIDADFNATFYALANKHFNDYSFVSTENSDKDEFKLAIYLPSAMEDPVVYNGKQTDITDADVFEKWLQVEALPYFGEIDGSVFNQYVESGLPLGYLFYDSDEDLDEYTPIFTKLAKDNRGLMNFVSIDAKKFGRHAANLNMKEQFPLFAIHDMIQDLKYGLPQLSEEAFDELTDKIVLESKAVESLVKDFLKGDATPIVKSQDVFETQDSSVFQLVGKNHDEIVNDPKKDVLVVYYAPWCGHCKRLAPIYQELADTYANATSDILIAKLDHTENDVRGVVIEGYPTIVFYPGGKDAESVVYQGSRTLDSLFDFVKENGHFGIDGQALYEEAQEKAAAESDDNELVDDLADEEDAIHDEL
ncbi:pdi1p [Saccharomyces arboricola H-6]|uniref:Protein disulfide-isomerase n=1 Tax=Saccharomyces arboricola (strain H-6 / AS 2.3317 / CBS 10644) TaxID=1160507 RepID=J8LQX0_SACAR|nr:pdi1p [Saccharomyces arboricola H-6]